MEKSNKFSVSLISDKYFALQSDFIEQKNETMDNSLLGFLFAALSMVLWAVGGLNVKFMKNMFKEIYDDNTVIMYRSIFIIIIAYGLLKYKNIPLFDILSIESRFWFFFRTFGNYWGFFFFIKSFDYLRLSTAACINSCYPIVSALISILILGEKFYMRYVYGLTLCLISTILISSNDKSSTKVGPHVENIVKDEFETIIGIAIATLGVIFTAIMNNASKVLASENIDVDNQSFYVGISNLITGITMAFLRGNFSFDMAYIAMSFIAGVIWYLAAYYILKAMMILGVARATPLAYITTVSMCIFGVIFFGESLYFSDIFASLLILGFNIYHTMTPLV